MADILEAPIDNHVHVSHSLNFISLYKISTQIGFEKYYYKFSCYVISHWSKYHQIIVTYLHPLQLILHFIEFTQERKIAGCASYPYGQMRYALPQTKTQYRILNLFDTLIGYATLSYHYRIFYVTLYCFAHN